MEICREESGLNRWRKDGRRFETVINSVDTFAFYCSEVNDKLSCSISLIFIIFLKNIPEFTSFRVIISPSLCLQIFIIYSRVGSCLLRHQSVTVMISGAYLRTESVLLLFVEFISAST